MTQADLSFVLLNYEGVYEKMDGLTKINEEVLSIDSEIPSTQLQLNLKEFVLISNLLHKIFTVRFILDMTKIL